MKLIMLLKKIPSIKILDPRITGALFAIFNLLFSLRLIWVVFTISPPRSGIKVMLAIISLQILLVLVGSIEKCVRFLLQPLHLTGGTLLLYFVFILSKRFLKPFLENQPEVVQAEVGVWFFGLFLFLALVILINFLRDLTNRALETVSRPSIQDAKSNLLKIGHAVILLTLIGYWVYTQIINPLPVYANYDPEYTYLMNSLTPFKDFELYVRMDHPGTFLQLAGSLIAVLLSPLSLFKEGYPYQYHIIQPEAFLFTARLILLLLNIAGIRLIYKVFRYPGTWSESFAGLGAMLIYFAAHRDAFDFLSIWSPNSFSFAVGTYLLIILYLFITSGIFKEYRNTWMISLAIGLAATFHIYLITLILCLLTAVLFASIFEKINWKETITITGFSAVGAAAGYLTGTLVILRYYPSFLDWILKVTTHQGSYGGGNAGFATLPGILENLAKLSRYNTALFVLWFISILSWIVIYLIQKNKQEVNTSTWAVILGVNLQILVLMVLFGKHPGHRYLLSVSALFPILITAAVKAVESRSRPASLIFGSVLIGLAVLFISKLDQSLIKHADKVTYFEQYQAEVESFKASQVERTGLHPDDIAFYWTYNTWSPCYSLWLGNEFSKTRFTAEVREICPGDLQYDIWSKPITDPENLRDPDVLTILIVNDRNFTQVSDRDYLTKIKSDVSNLGFILID